MWPMDSVGTTLVCRTMSHELMQSGIDNHEGHEEHEG